MISFGNDSIIYLYTIRFHFQVSLSSVSLSSVSLSSMINDKFMTDYKQVFASANISESTRKSYIEKMSQLMSLCNNEIPTLDQFRKLRLTESTRYVMCCVLLAYRKHKGLPREYDWQVYYKDLNGKIQKYDNVPSPKQIASMITYNDILVKIDQTTDLFDRLLLMLYSLIPPVRANYGQVTITNKHVPFTNHIYNGTLYLYNLKVKGNVVVDLPDMIKLTLDKLKPSTYIFGREMTNRQFSKFANRRLKHLFDKPVTLTTLRHVYINNLDMNKLSTRQRDDIAKLMNHSLYMQDRYRLKVVD